MTEKYLNFTIFLGLMSSLVICILFGPYIVSNKTERYWHNVSLSVVEFVYAFTMIFIVCMEIRFIRRKEKFHRAQTVFWPKRCCHCFQMLSPQDKWTHADPVSHERDDSKSEETTNPILSATLTSIQETCERYSSSTPLQDGALNHLQLSDTSNENERLEHTTSEISRTSLETPCLVRRCSITPTSGSNGDISQGSCTGKHLPGQHRALLNVYGVFCFVSCVGLFLESIRHFICYGQGEYSAWITFSYVAPNMGFIILLPSTLAFVNAYIDAFYVDSYHNLFTIAPLLILSIGKCAGVVFEPIEMLLASRYSNNESLQVSCRINGTFFDIYDHIDHIAGPFYTETSMIMLGISLQLWSSFVSKTSINSRRNPIATESCKLDISFSRRCSISLNFKQCLRRFLNLIRSKNSENQPLISRYTSHRFPKVRFVTWIVFVTANLPYLGLSLMYVFHPSEIAEQYHEYNISMSVEIAFCFTFFVLCAYAQLREKKIPHVLYGKVDGSSWKLKGHEIMLIVCSYGIFTQCILLLTAGAGNLINNGNVMSPEEHTSCKIAIVYAVVKILTAWQMTVFLSRIPRQKFGNPSEHVKIKLVLVCLISVMVICGVQWLITSLENKMFLLQRLYFGDKAGKAIGILLEPFGTIYSLHAATVAYELYGEILSRMK